MLLSLLVLLMLPLLHGHYPCHGYLCYYCTTMDGESLHHIIYHDNCSIWGDVKWCKISSIDCITISKSYCSHAGFPRIGSTGPVFRRPLQHICQSVTSISTIIRMTITIVVMLSITITIVSMRI